MSVNPLTHLSNTICYIDKPPPSQTQKALLEAARNAQRGELGAAGSVPEAGKPAEPGPTINAGGQALGRIINASA